MKKIKVAILSPKFPPDREALGDFSIIIGTKLREISYEVYYLCPGLSRDFEGNKYWGIESNRNAFQEILDKIKFDILFINYSGYGYQKKGIPLWLESSISKLDNVFIITFFHELYSSGPIYSLSFWLHPIQKWIFKSIYKKSNLCFCTNSIVQNIIIKQSNDTGKKCIKSGLISTIGEPTDIPVKNNKLAVVFGTAGLRQKVYYLLEKDKKLLESLGVETLIDIGSDIDIPNVGNISIRRMGRIESKEVIQLLTSSIFGLIAYPNHLLGKSSVFAAYAACKMTVFNLVEGPKLNEDGLYIGQHYLTISTLKNSDKNISKDYSAIAENLHQWYVKHNSQQFVNTIDNYIKKVKEA